MIIKIEKKTKKQKRFIQFSKRCLAAMIVLWFIGAIFGFTVAAVQTARGDMTVSVGEVLAYIGAPMTGGIVSYMIKSAWEKGKENNINKEDNSI